MLITFTNGDTLLTRVRRVNQLSIVWPMASMLCLWMVLCC